VPGASDVDRHSVVTRFFRNPATGEVVVVQLPNVALGAFLAATAARLLFTPHGTTATVLGLLATASLVVWAVLEIARGESPFRRLLGGLVLLGIVIRLLTR
jgi:hypothetical protein